METNSLERTESLEQLRALENGVKVHVLVTAKQDRPASTRQKTQRRWSKSLPARNGEGASMKYIFITGGVVSSLGKGLTAASLGTLLEARVCALFFKSSIRI